MNDAATQDAVVTVEKWQRENQDTQQNLAARNRIQEEIIRAYIERQKKGRMK